MRFLFLSLMTCSAVLFADNRITMEPEALHRANAVECRRAGVCAEICDALRQRRSFCSRSSHRMGTEVEVIERCNSWEAVCEQSFRLRERGTANPAYNWRRISSEARCWVSRNAWDREFRERCSGD